MYIGGEVKVSDVGRSLMTILEEYGSDQQMGQTVPQSSLHPSATDLETAAVEVLTLLDQGPIQPSMSMTEAVLLAADVGQTLLHLTASLGFESLLTILLDHRVDPDLRDANGFTALHFTALYGHVRCTRLLVHEGADVDLMDIWGRTAQHVALESNHQDVAAANRINFVEFASEDDNGRKPRFVKGTETEPQSLDSPGLSSPNNPKDSITLRSVRWLRYALIF